MSPLFMDTGYEPNSPGSLSAEECNSNTAGSEREGEGPGMENRGTKRRQKNRDAARKSRKKQTERADELHKELQSLEQSNSAFQKEIAALKKDVHLYTTALERHKPFCCLRVTGSSSTNHLSVSSSPVDATLPQKCSSPPKNPPQTSCSSLAAATSLCTSLTPSLGHHTHDCIDNPISSTVVQSPSKQDIHESSSMSANALLHINSPTLLPSSHTAPSTLHSGVLDAFLTNQASFQTASSNLVRPYSHLRRAATENAGLAAQGFPMNVPQRHPCQFSGSPKNPSPPCILLPTPLQDPALQSLSVSPQANQNPAPAPAFALKPSYSQQMTPTPASLLSLLTVPSPLDVPQTTSSSFDGLLAQPPSSLPPLGEPSRDLFLSELLEVNDWILNGTSNL